MANNTDFVSSDTIRDMFSRAMSTMYQQEVPQYGELMSLVQDINTKTLQAKPELKEQFEKNGELERLSEERHGAIRLGTAAELKTMGELFAVMGMHPVNYYDLTVADIPVHSTAFRPIDDESLKKNPFRMFTSLLRTDLISDEAIRNEVEATLAKRDIYTPRLRELIATHKQQGGLTKAQAEEFVQEALETFRWHEKATVSEEAYKRFHDVHRLAADVVSFRGPHINHLTPRTLDIDKAQEGMPERGINPKAFVEGPPRRNIPILLRQTSFKALEEEVEYMQQDGSYKPGAHTARFGEIEQRGAALTRKGQALYDELLNKTRAKAKPAADGDNVGQYMQALEEEFKVFPDDFETMRRQELAFVQYRATQKGKQMRGKLGGKSLDDLLRDGYISASPIIYEDFLPVSAAGIFTSNLGDDAAQTIQATPNQQAFEKDLGMKVQDPFELYQAKQDTSLQQAYADLGFEQDSRVAR